MGLWSIIVNGVETNFDALGFYVEGAPGAGMPRVTVQHTPYGIQDGGAFQRTWVPPRVLTLRGTIIGTTLSNYHDRRNDLIALLRRDNQASQQPVTLKYTGGPVTPLLIDAYFEEGLGLGERRGFAEQLQLRFLCLDPYWRASSASNATLTRYSSVTINGVAERSTTGRWSALGSGISTSVLCVIYGVDGHPRVGGTNLMQRWTGAAWAAMGTAPVGAVRALARAGGADLYAAGTFTAIGGTAATRIARFNSAAGTWAALGSGLNNTVNGLAWKQGYSGLGELYVAGDFSTAGGIAANFVAMWDENTNTWSALPGIASSGKAIVAAPDGTIYVAADQVRRWTGSTWSAVGSLSGTPNMLAVGPDGTLYAGRFTDDAVLRWAGGGWEQIADFDGTLNAIHLDANGTLFASDGPQLSRLAGGEWHVERITGIAPATPCGIAADTTGKIVVAAPTASVTTHGVTTVTNTGSAEAAPTITATVSTSATGAFYLLCIANLTTGAIIDLELFLLPGETVLIDCAARTITSNSRGNLLSALQGGSALGSFTLLPGPNSIGIYGDLSGNLTVSCSYTPRYWSLDG